MVRNLVKKYWSGILFGLLFVIIFIFAILLANYYNKSIDESLKKIEMEQKELKKQLDLKEKEINYYKAVLDSLTKEIKGMKFTKKVYKGNIRILAEEFKKRGF
jgi:peptidoglycan hydrolase CwlO-like protein